MIHCRYPLLEGHPLGCSQAGPSHRDHNGSGGGEDVEVAGERVVLVVRAALEPGVEKAAAVLVAFAVDVCAAVDVVGLAAREVLPERRRRLAAVAIDVLTFQHR